MKCDECNKIVNANEKLQLERVPTGYGGTRIKQICEECQYELEHYWDCKREEANESN